MGKRSRKSRPADTPAAPPRRRTEKEGPEVKDDFVSRAKASWQLAGTGSPSLGESVKDARRGVRPTAPWKQSPGKPRRAPAEWRGEDTATPSRPMTDAERRRAERKRRRDEREAQRPPALWGSFPVSELLIFAGTIALVAGLITHLAPLLFGGIAGVAIASLEFAAREHVAGFRSHSLLLGLAPTAVMHVAVAVAITGAGASPILFVADVIVFGLAASTLGSLFKRWEAESDLARSD